MIKLHKHLVPKVTDIMRSGLTISANLRRSVNVEQRLYSIFYYFFVYYFGISTLKSHNKLTSLFQLFFTSKFNLKDVDH